jgi:hypothetical protein
MAQHSSIGAWVHGRWGVLCLRSCCAGRRGGADWAAHRWRGFAALLVNGHGIDRVAAIRRCRFSPRTRPRRSDDGYLEGLPKRSTRIDQE